MALRRIRLSKWQTQRDVARAIGMEFAYVSRLESEAFASLPTRATIAKIATAMQCTAVEEAEPLAAAGRVSEPMQTRPELRRLFRTAGQLSPSAIRPVRSRNNLGEQDHMAVKLVPLAMLGGQVR